MPLGHFLKGHNLIAPQQDQVKTWFKTNPPIEQIEKFRHVVQTQQRELELILNDISDHLYQLEDTFAD